MRGCILFLLAVGAIPSSWALDRAVINRAQTVVKTPVATQESAKPSVVMQKTQTVPISSPSPVPASSVRQRVPVLAAPATLPKVTAPVAVPKPVVASPLSRQTTVPKSIVQSKTAEVAKPRLMHVMPTQVKVKPAALPVVLTPAIAFPSPRPVVTPKPIATPSSTPTVKASATPTATLSGAVLPDCKVDRLYGVPGGFFYGPMRSDGTRLITVPTGIAIYPASRSSNYIVKSSQIQFKLSGAALDCGGGACSLSGTKDIDSNNSVINFGPNLSGYVKAGANLNLRLTVDVTGGCNVTNSNPNYVDFSVPVPSALSSSHSVSLADCPIYNCGTKAGTIVSGQTSDGLRLNWVYAELTRIQYSSSGNTRYSYDCGGESRSVPAESLQVNPTNGWAACFYPKLNDPFNSFEAQPSINLGAIYGEYNCKMSSVSSVLYCIPK